MVERHSISMSYKVLDFVLASDYDALAAELADLQSQLLLEQGRMNVHWRQIQDQMARIRELEAAEHAARCDLIDALFYVGMVWGQFGFPPTAVEREVAKSFYDRIQAKYPLQKGRFASEKEAGK